MNRSTILKDLNAIFTEVMDLEDFKLLEEHTTNHLDDWDSLTHIQVITEIEKKYELRFTTIEIEDFKNVGSMIDAVLDKQLD